MTAQPLIILDPDDGSTLQARIRKSVVDAASRYFPTGGVCHLRAAWPASWESAQHRRARVRGW